MPAAKLREEQILNFNADVITSTLTGFVSGSGTVSATDTLLQATQKLDGNDGLKVPKTTTVAGFALSGNVTLANLTNGTGITGGSYNGSTTVAHSVDQAFTPSWTGLHTHLKTGATGNTIYDGVLLTNTTTASSGQQMYSPALHFSGQGWKTTATAASQSVDFKNYLIPIQSTTNPSYQLVWDGSVNGGAYTTLLSIDNFGSLFIAGTFTTTGTLNMNISGIGTSSVSGLVSANPTLALVGAQVQYAPRIRMQGQAWNTTGAVSETDNWTIENQPAAGNPTTATLVFAASINGGAYVNRMTIASGGLVTISQLSNLVNKTTLATQNTGATLTAAQMQTGVVCTATTAVAYTTATATATATQLGVTGNGFWYDWTVDNSASSASGVITITLGAGFTAMTAITGENTLTIAIGIVAVYRIVFTSATVAKIGRLI